MDVTEQAQLQQLLERFSQEHSELDAQVRAALAIPPFPEPTPVAAVVSTGTSTTPNGIAYLGAGTSGNR